MEHQMTNKTAETLHKAKALISNPKNWNKGGWTPDDDGEPIHGKPCCAAGAICLSGGKDTLNDPCIVLLSKAIDPKYEGPVIANYNDSPNTTHDDIMALFDRAIELAEKETT